MKRPMLVIASSGLVTSLAWWSAMRVEDHSLVLTNGVGDTEGVFVVASLRSEGEAQALLRTVSDRIALGAGTFDVGDWPTLGRAGQSSQGEG